MCPCELMANVTLDPMGGRIHNSRLRSQPAIIATTIIPSQNCRNGTVAAQIHLTIKNTENTKRPRLLFLRLVAARKYGSLRLKKSSRSFVSGFRFPAASVTLVLPQPDPTSGWLILPKPAPDFADERMTADVLPRP